MKYRRAYILGGSYFFTLVTYKRRQVFITPDIVKWLMTGIQTTQKSHPFDSVAMVILPDHLHAIWSLPEDDADFSMRWRLIKSYFTRVYSATFQKTPPVWQNRFWEHVIRDEIDLKQHVDYIHYNPVKHGLTRSPADWKFSSIHRYIHEGLLPSDWGGSASLNLGDRIGHE